MTDSTKITDQHGRALYFDYLETPIGEMEICANDNYTLYILFVKTEKLELQRKVVRQNNVTTGCKEQLQKYFEGTLKNFNLPLFPNGTDFQTKVWKELQNISYGKTISYLDLAKKLGDVKSIRAAASANGKNPITLIIPCHRVVGSNKELTGYSGDLWRKQWLLEHEEKQMGSVLKLF